MSGTPTRVRPIGPAWLETALFTATGWKLPHPVAERVAGKPGCRIYGRILYFGYSSQGCRRMTLYGYARVSVREPEDKNLDLQVERLVRAGCAMGNIRAEEASGAKDDRGGLLELLDLVVKGDTLVVTHIDRLSRGLTYGLQVIEGLHHAGVEFRSLSEDFDTATANGKLQLQMVLAFSEWWRNSIRERSVAGQAKARTEGRFPRPAAGADRPATRVHPGGAVKGSEPAGAGQAPGGQPLDHPAGGRVRVDGNCSLRPNPVCSICEPPLFRHSIPTSPAISTPSILTRSSTPGEYTSRLDFSIGRRTTDLPVRSIHHHGLVLI